MLVVVWMGSLGCFDFVTLFSLGVYCLLRLTATLGFLVLGCVLGFGFVVVLRCVSCLVCYCLLGLCISSLLCLVWFVSLIFGFYLFDLLT